MLTPRNAKRGFTLIELLTVIAILAILGAIIFPTVGQFRTLAKKTSDSNDLRNIVQASQLFAAQNGERLVDVDQVLSGQGIGTGTQDIVDVAAILAWGGELADPGSWVSANESLPASAIGGLFTNTDDDADPLTPDVLATSTNYAPADLSYSYVVGLQTSDPATTPVVFTRMDNDTDSVWSPNNPYGNDGGHVAFLGGSVSWYEDLTGKLIAADGSEADNIDAAIPSIADIRQSLN